MAVWAVGLTIQDSQGDKAVTHFYVDGIIATTELQQLVNQLANLVDDIIHGQLVGFTATYLLATPTGIKSAPEADSHVERGARFGWLAADGDIVSNRIATMEDQFFVGEEVDTADALVLAFTNAITAGITVGATTYQFQDRHGSDIGSLISARRQHKKER